MVRNVNWNRGNTGRYKRKRRFRRRIEYEEALRRRKETRKG